MIFPLVVGSATGVLVFLSVLLKPFIHVGKMRLGTYWIISLVGAILILLSGKLPLSSLLSELFSDSAVNPVKILVLFFSMTSMSVFLDEVGFFRHLAVLALRKAGKNQFALFISLYAVVSVLTVFTSNDIVVLTFTPFICFFAKNARINPMPYLMAEFVAANTWSMFLIIGNPTNIYLASSAGIDFVSYMLKMALPTVAAGIVSLIVLLLLFRKSLCEKMEVSACEDTIEDKPSIFIGVTCLSLCTVLLAVSSYIGFEMYLICAVFAIILFLSASVVSVARKKGLAAEGNTFKRLPYELIFFVVSMFVIVLVMNATGATERIALLLSGENPVFTIGLSSFFASNVINNIPMSVLFSSILKTGFFSGADYTYGVLAAVIGSNIGAYFTPVGALAGIMWTSALKRAGVEFSFRRFVMYGAIISIPTLLSSLGCLWIITLF